MNMYAFEELLEECRKELSAGKSLKDILADHPAQAQQLEPLLQSILVVSSLPKPVISEEKQALGRNQLLSEVENLRKKNHFHKNGTKGKNIRYSGRWFEKIGNLLVGQENTDMKLIPRLAIYLVITILVGGFFTVNASASSLPGDVLYGLKLNWEQAQLVLAFSDETKQELEDEFEDERLSEVESLLSEGREEDVEFSGIVDEQTETYWIVSGVKVSVGPETEIKDTPMVGDQVKVEAVTQADGSLFALEISLDLDDLDDGEIDDIDDIDDGAVDDLDDDSADDVDDESADDVDDGSDDTPEPEETDEPESTEEPDDTPSQVKLMKTMKTTRMIN